MHKEKGGSFGHKGVPKNRGKNRITKKVIHGYWSRFNEKRRETFLVKNGSEGITSGDGLNRAEF